MMAGPPLCSWPVRVQEAGAVAGGHGHAAEQRRGPSVRSRLEVGVLAERQVGLDGHVVTGRGVWACSQAPSSAGADLVDAVRQARGQGQGVERPRGWRPWRTPRRAGRRRRCRGGCRRRRWRPPSAGTRRRGRRGRRGARRTMLPVGPELDLGGGHRHDPRALLAQALGHQLLDPQPEGRERARGHVDGELVAPLALRPRPMQHAEARRRPPRRRRRPAGSSSADVDPDEGGGHQAEQRQDRVAAADVGVVDEDPRVALARRPPAAALVPGSVTATQRRPVGHRRPEVGGERPRLEGAARLRRHEEERSPRPGCPPRSAGSVVSHTTSRSVRWAARSTSGPSDEPPMPEEHDPLDVDEALGPGHHLRRTPAGAARATSSQPEPGRRPRNPRATGSCRGPAGGRRAAHGLERVARADRS